MFLLFRFSNKIFLNKLFILKLAIYTTTKSNFFLTNKSLAPKDYYKILGIAKNADSKEIKKAYYQLAKKYHPDQPSGDKTKFQEVSEAYEVLGDEKKRQMYDTEGFNPNNAGQSSSSYGSSAGGFNYQSQMDPEELFRTIFGDAFTKGKNFESMFDRGFENDYSQQNEISQVKNNLNNLY